MYRFWVMLYDSKNITKSNLIDDHIIKLENKPLISVLMPVYNPKIEHLEKAIDSIIDQIYTNWELCIVDDDSSDIKVLNCLRKYAKHGNIKVKFRVSNGHISKASNDALDMASGEFVALFDHDDILPPHSLATIVSYINKFPKAKVLYSDEDKIDGFGERSNPYFKGGFNYDLLLCQNCISHLGIYSKGLLAMVGGFREGLEGSQDYDLVLRCSEILNSDEIIHIPHVLYHWRIHENSTSQSIDSKSYTTQASIKALLSHHGKNDRRVNQIDLRDEVTFFKTSYEPNSSLMDLSIIIEIENREQMNQYFHIGEKCKVIFYLKDRKENKFLSLKEDQVLEIDKGQNLVELINNLIQKKTSKFYGFIRSNLHFSSEELVNVISSLERKDVSVVGGKVIFRDKIDSFGLGIVNNKVINLCRGMSLFNTDNGGIQFLSQNVTAVNGDMFFISYNAWEKAGQFDKNLELDNSIIKYCLTSKKQSFKCVVLPDLQLKINNRKKSYRNVNYTDQYLSPNLDFTRKGKIIYLFPPRVKYPWQK